DRCDGTSLTCQHPAGNGGTICRQAVAGGCDVAEACTGSSTACPPDVTRPDDTGCTDNNACTIGERCHAGLCNGGTTVTCPAANLCTSVSACVPATGCPAPVAINEGGACNDGSPNAPPGECVAGVCRGTTFAEVAGTSYGQLTILEV